MRHDAGGRESHVNARWRLRHRPVLNGGLGLWYCDQGCGLPSAGYGCASCVFLECWVLFVPLEVSLCMVSEPVSKLPMGRVS